MGRPTDMAQRDVSQSFLTMTVIFQCHGGWVDVTDCDWGVFHATVML